MRRDRVAELDYLQIIDKLMSTEHSDNFPWLTPFSKILDLENANGFSNKSVMGGLDKFLIRWSESLSRFCSLNNLSDAFCSPIYTGLSKDQRSVWVCNWNDVIKNELQRSRSGQTRDTGIKSSRDIKCLPADGLTLGPERFKKPPVGLKVNSPIDRLKGVDTKLSARFKRLDVATVKDLLYLFPRRHLDYGNVVKIADLTLDAECTVVGNIWEARQISLGQKGRLKATEAIIGDDTGNIKVVWFGQGYLANSLKANATIAISGKPEIYRGHRTFQSPEYELVYPGREQIHTGRAVPVYPLTEGINARNMRRITKQAVDDWLGGLDDPIPGYILQRHNLLGLQQAVNQAHYPDNSDSWYDSRRRLAFDELLILQLAVLQRRRHRNLTMSGVSLNVDSLVVNKFIDSLPFPLTNAQQRCVLEILENIRTGTPPMNRLLQGDVGSGKTVVVLIALLVAISAGYQGGLMVPTEILAEQHFQTIASLLGAVADSRFNNVVTANPEGLSKPISIGLLTGSTPAKVRREITSRASDGSLDLLIGTHTLIQSGIDLPNLALAVMDEQHRFGVIQRSELRQQGLDNPHSLVLSATPIPRTLSLTLYGDLDISTLDELPPGRQPIPTRFIESDNRDVAYGFLRRQIEEGRQGFIICPLINESESIDAKAATDEFERLSKEIYPDLSLALLHGRMTSKEKDRVMRVFRDGEVNILVSTSVVEVGIDVPNASVMMIEGADRFGLSQLHQFRGRVGRGEHKSYCILLSDDPSELAKARLSKLEQFNDGFKLAEADLELRGPGDFFGTRQSGLPNLKMAHLSDRDLLADARKEANALLEKDPDLSQEIHRLLAEEVSGFLDQASSEFS